LNSTGEDLEVGLARSTTWELRLRTEAQLRH
jgi:hypothetical protein